MQDRWGRAVAGFAVFQAGDAIACAKLGYIQRDLDRLNCPPRIRRMLPLIKAASAAGLLGGRRWPRLGRLTGAALSAYFVCALGFHMRAKDPLWRSVPAASLLALSAAVAIRGYQDTETDTSSTVEVDLTTRQDEPAFITV
jgi:hypothetical protein